MRQQHGLNIIMFIMLVLFTGFRQKVKALRVLFDARFSASLPFE